MTEFKQIVGRGTRVHEDTGKLYFTLMDFRGATNHFADPVFDGEPVQVYSPGPDGPITPPDDDPAVNNSDGDEETSSGHEDAEETVVIGAGIGTGLGNGGPLRKIYVDGVGATIVAERVEYLDEYGKLITESLRDFTRKALKRRYSSLDDFLKRWKTQQKKQAVLDELAAEGLPIESVAQELGKDLDPFDLICHIAFDAKPLTRRERADGVKKRDAFAKYGPTARAVLEALLDKYADDGLIDFDDPKILKINPFSHMGTEVELMRAFGKKQDYLQAMHDLQAAIYDESA
jgi:type I restriction enzyme, R subunit